ncbi:MAG: PAS domain-containing protein, partial [Verrucomicrobia bacterium]|nr:PAS domain-containing protein [Verrucomicrobiota bacterium]
ETLPHNIFLKDSEGRFTFANHHFCNTIEKPLEEILSKTDFNFFPKELAEKYRADDKHILETGQTFETIEEHQDPGRGITYVNVVKTPVKDGAGNVIGIQGIFWDVTERRQMEETIAYERDLLQTLLENSPDRIYFKDKKSRFIKCSRTVAQGLGITTPEQAIGKTDFDFFTEEHARPAFEDEQKIIKTGEPIIGLVEKETWLDGRETFVLTNKLPLRNKLGEVIGTFGISKDITDLKRAEDQLGYERDLLQTLLDNAPDCIYFKDKESRFIRCSKALAERFGCTSPEELYGKTDRDFFAEEHAKEAMDDEQEIMRTGKPVIGKIEREPTPDGTVTWALTTKMPRRDEKGNIIGTFGISKDITQLKKVEKELEVTRDAALESARLKSEFLANMSHEIRTPMNTIIGMTGLLIDTQLNEEQKDFANTVRSSADALLNIINDILDFSKIEAGKLMFESIDFNFLELVESSVELVATRAQSKEIELACWVHHEIPIGLRGDPGRIRQVLTNLLTNAVKFTNHGEVVIRAAKEKETKKDITIRIEVKDTGAGISKKAQALLFQPFTQADGSMTRKYGGTGLGLAISKQLVEMMNGEIGAESEPGQGSTFWFTIKLEKQPESATTPKIEAAKESLAGLRVLIVDDNATNRQILHHQISGWRMRSGYASNGKEALTILRDEAKSGFPYDLAILDMQMPEMDGLTLAKEIRRNPVTSDLKIIILTSLGQRINRQLVRELGINAVLMKPVKQSKLFDCLADTMVESLLPATEHKAPEESQSSQATLEAHPKAKKVRILLAEDNIVNQKVSLRQLRKLGYTADAVANGIEVIQAISSIPYDIILMDCQMPEMDGYDATRRIRQIENEASSEGRPCQHHYIIALTANALQGDREKCLASGMNDYISKPVQIADLQISLYRAVSATSPRDEQPADPEQPAAEEVLDSNALAGLRELRIPGEPDPLVELVDLFLEDAPKKLERIKTSLKSNDTKTLTIAAHSLKGSSSNLGARKLSSLCAELENQAKANNTVESPALIDKIEIEFDRVVKALINEKNK